MSVVDQYPWLQGFSDEQLSSASHEAAHALVSASPGSGKTKMVIGHCGVVMARGIKPERILGLAFNVDAAKEVNRRLADLPVPGAKRLKFRTIHSFCKEVVEAAEKAGFLPKRELVAEEFKEVAMAREAMAMVEKTVGDVDELKVAALRMGLTLAKSKLIPLDGSVPHTDLLRFTENDEDVAKAILAHEKARAEAGVRTFNDLIYDLAIEIPRNPKLAEWMSGEFDKIIVDEYQDVDDAQQCVIFALAGISPSFRSKTLAQIFVVGDEDQCIYGWRGSELSYMQRRFEEILGKENVTRYQLSRTFRYGHEIAVAANSLIRNNEERPLKVCVSNETTPRSTVAIRMASTKTGDRYWPQAMMDEIQDWNAQGRRNREVAVLVRTYELAAPLEMHLIRTGTPYTLDGKGILSMPEVKAVNAFAILSDAEVFEACGEEGKEQVLSAALQSPGMFLPRRIVERLAESLSTMGLHEVPGALRAVGAADGLRPFQVSMLHKRAAFIESLSSGELSMNDLATRVWRGLEWAADVKKRIADPLKQSDRLNVINLMCREIARYESVDAMVDAYSARFEQQAEPESMMDPIRIMSIHKSKGLEFPLVLIPGFNEGSFPHQMPDAVVDMEAERRLAFVAMTRAIERLVLIAPNDLELANRWKIPVNPGASRTPEEAEGITSRFLKELDPDCVRAARTWFYGEGNFSIVESLHEYAAKAGKPVVVGHAGPATPVEQAKPVEVPVVEEEFNFGF